RHARVDVRVLARRRSVQLGAEAVEDLGDLECRVMLRSLEEEVLDEVGDPRLRVRLVAGAGSDPVADRDRAGVVEPLRDHALARVELRQLPVLHTRIVRRRETPPVTATTASACTAAPTPRITDVSCQKRSG